MWYIIYFLILFMISEHSYIYSTLILHIYHLVYILLIITVYIVLDIASCNCDAVVDRFRFVVCISYLPVSYLFLVIV